MNIYRTLFSIIMLMMLFSAPSATFGSDLIEAKLEIKEDNIMLDDPTLDQTLEFNFSLAIVADYSFYSDQFFDKTRITEMAQGIASNVTFYFQNNSIPITFNLDLVMIFTDITESDATLGTDTTGNGLLLDAGTFFDGNSTFDSYDFIHLLTKRRLAGNAFIGNDVTGPARVSYNGYTSSTWAQYIISTHELGHNFGAVHDDDVGCIDKNYIMSTSILAGAWEFSSCSKEKIFKVLRIGANDLTAPTLTGRITATINVDENYRLTFPVNDSNPNVYDLYLDGLLVVGNASWDNSDVVIGFDVPTNEIGTFNITLVVWDYFLQYSNQTTIVNVVDIFDPVISLESYKFNIDETSLIEIVVSDHHVDHATILVNGTIEQSMEDFKSNIFSLDFSLYKAGTYNITVEAVDTSSNTAIQTAWVTIVQDTIFGEVTITTTLSITVTDSFAPFPILSFLVMIPVIVRGKKYNK